MNRRSFLSSAALAAVTAASVPALAVPLQKTVEVYKNRSCGCCGSWVTHLKSAGFAVTVKEVPDTGVVRKRLGLPDANGSCHTAVVDGYALEGHVPAAQIRRLLASRPDAIGLAVPGMPASSPGMDMPGANDRYDVLLVDRRGGSTVFARYPS